MKKINGHKTTIVAVCILLYQLVKVIFPELITHEIDEWVDQVILFALTGTIGHKAFRAATPKR